MGDLLDKPHASGVLELSRYTVSAVLATLIIGLLAFPQRAERIPATNLGPRTMGEDEVG